MCEISTSKSNLMIFSNQMFSILEMHTNNQEPNLKSCYKYIKHKLQIGFEQYWRTLIETDISLSQAKKGGNKFRKYRTFKYKFEFKNYFNIRCPIIRTNFSQFRLSAHKLRIETDRYKSNGAYIPSKQRMKKIEGYMYFGAL